MTNNASGPPGRHRLGRRIGVLAVVFLGVWPTWLAYDQYVAGSPSNAVRAALMALLLSATVLTWHWFSFGQRGRMGVFMAVVISLALLGGYGFFVSTSPQSAPSNTEAIGTSGAALPTQSVPRMLPSSEVSINSECGSEAPISRPLPVAQICVVYWCKGDVFSETGELVVDKLEIKLRPRIVNNSDKQIDVSTSKRSAILLLVSDPDADSKWSPPPLTNRANDRPRLVEFDGAQYWGLPPNVNGDFKVASNGYYTGFGSSWYEAIVAPGGSFLETSRDANHDLVHRGNLVFEVPAIDGKIGVVGIVLINRTNGRVLAVQPFSLDPPMGWV